MDFNVEGPSNTDKCLVDKSDYVCTCIQNDVYIYNECNDMTKQQTHFALRAPQRYLFMSYKHHKGDAFQVTIQLLMVVAKEIYMRTQGVCAKGVNAERRHINCSSFATCL